MADSKVTDLATATTPLAGTEVLYVVQGGNDTKATAQDIANLAPDPSISDIVGLQPALDAKQNLLSLTTTGSSGAATLIGDTLNIPEYAAGSGVSADLVVPMARNNRIAFMGTSEIAAEDSYGDILMRIEPRLQRTRNCAGSGQQTPWMANRFNTNVLNWEPGMVLIAAGRNNLTTAYNETIRMIEEVRASGAIAIVANSYGYVLQTSATNLLAYNAALKAYCNPANGVDGVGATDPGIIFLDIFSVMFNADGTNKYAVSQSTAAGANSGGATVINVTDASQFTAGTGQFVWCATGQINKPCVIIARDTGANTITISRATSGAITSGTNIYSHPYMNDGDHAAGNGSLLLAEYAKTVINDAGILSDQRPRRPLRTVSAAEMSGGATENVFGRFATMEGSAPSGLHEGILTQLGSGNYSVVTDSDFLGKCQQFTIPAGTAAGNAFFITDTSFYPTLNNLAGRLVAFHMKYKTTGWQNAGATYSINMNGGTFGHFPQFPQGLTSDYPNLFLRTVQMFDGTFEAWGVGYMPTDMLEGGLPFNISLPYAVPSGVTPPTFKIGELSLVDIDDPQLPRRWSPRSRIVTTSTSLSFTDELVYINSASDTNQTLPVLSGTTSPMVSGQPMILINKGTGTATIIGTVNGVVNPKLASAAILTIYYDASGGNWRTNSVTASSATITIPSGSGQYEYEATVTDSSISPTDTINIRLAPTLDSDENSTDMLSLETLAARAGTGNFTVNMAFREKTSGAIKLNYFKG